MKENSQTLSELQGIEVSEGLALGVLKKISFDPPLIVETPCPNPEKEVERLREAINKSQDQIRSLIERKKAFLGEDEIQIFEAHLMMLEDPEFIEQMIDQIRQQKREATKAVAVVSQDFAQMLAALPDPYLSARSHDVHDIAQRLLRQLSSTQTTYDDSFQGILVLKDIAPSFVAELDPQKIQGVLTEQGGRTSHAAILLRNLEIPAIFGVPQIFSLVSNNQTLLMDARNGKVLLHPSAADRLWFEKQQELYQNEKIQLQALRLVPAQTQEGLRINLYANMGGLAELPLLERFSPDGVGLFRTEFLFLDRATAPSEEEQENVYKKVLQNQKGRKVVIRTLDIGGDKVIPYLKFPEEENPFLGLRGLRLCLKHQELFRTQIRALLKASSSGSLSIMYPMVTQLPEWEAAQKIVQEESQKLQAQGVVISPHIQYGIMIEVPAAAIMAEAFAPHVDFFSLGTNDLIQYTCACDRLNPSVKNLYTSFEPAVLKLIAQVAGVAQKYQKELSLCGEMGGEVMMTPFLIGLGFKNLSMSPHFIPKIKARLQSLSLSACQSLAEELLQIPSAEEVETRLRASLLSIDL